MDNEFRLNKLFQHTDLGIALALMGTLLVMILPVPAWLMDLLIVANIALSIAVLLVSVYSGKPLDFSVFPTMLLFSTLFRLSINVASIRLILLNGHNGTAAAGHVIETFGQFVVGGNYVVGTVIFIILIIINFVVITKGSGRVAEVAARFILDAMPGKQMSIDADLNAGLINEEQARDRRKRIEQEADFYGAMDGASKFVRGDAIAAILITLINSIGGLAIGVFQKGLGLGTAAEYYTLMTIGDGLVTQIPSLIVSTAAGIVVTRAASGSELSKQLASQIFLQPRAIGFTSVILFIMGLMPGLPALPFLLLSVVGGSIALAVRRIERAKNERKTTEERKQLELSASETSAPPDVDVLELQVGYGLVGLVDPEAKGDLVDRIYQLRKEFAKDLGIIVPKVRIKDNLELQPAQYSILIKGVSVGGGELMTGSVLAMDPGTVSSPVAGLETKEPVFGLSALWVNEKQREKAQIAGYTVVDHPSIIATHLSEIIRKHAHELIGRQELQALIDNISKHHPKVVEELIPKVLSLGAVLKVCQNLLREQVPIRDLTTVLETLANTATQSTDPDTLTEYVRSSLARTITHRLTLGTNELEVMTFQPQTEEALIRAYQKTDVGVVLNIEPNYFERLVQALQRKLDQTVFSSGSPVLLCHPLIRSQLKRLLERFLPELSIVSANEIAPFAKVKSLATVEASS
ncbi:MAG: flagellar biosynthesis protein FlhA [Deltaproteobacteria bacterium]|nr:flagellar biosynthesis protein FlhA [Deltaproteobacteria bacterium]